MKPNKLTPGANVMWESSRMMLPEHVESILKQKQEAKKKPKPEFDEQHLVQVERMIRDYIQTDVKLYVIIYGEYEDKEYYARITNYDPHLRRMKIEWDEEIEWVKIDDIIDIFT